MSDNAFPDASLNNCFGCGPLNPHGLRLQFHTAHDSSGVWTASASVTLSHDYEGGKGSLHGGIIATLLDEAMSKLSAPLGVRAVTRHIDIDYLRLAPVDQDLTVVARHQRREGRKLFHAAELLDGGGHVLARASGVFIVIGHPDHSAQAPSGG